MKYTLISTLALLFIFSSCQHQVEETIKERDTTTICLRNTESTYPPEEREISICTTDTCTKYFAIWEELIQERNNLSEDFMEAHIEPYYAGTNTWTKGISFTICYKIKVGWAITNTCDKFIIYIDPDNSHYPHRALPRGRELTKEEIVMTLEDRIFSSRIAKINNTTEVEHSSMEDALDDLINFSGVNTLCFNRITLNKEGGNLTLNALAQYENEENLCIQGTFDLITGEKSVLDSYCYIIN